MPHLLPQCGYERRHDEKQPEGIGAQHLGTPALFVCVEEFSLDLVLLPHS